MRIGNKWGAEMASNTRSKTAKSPTVFQKPNLDNIAMVLRMGWVRDEVRRPITVPILTLAYLLL